MIIYLALCLGIVPAILSLFCSTFILLQLNLPRNHFRSMVIMLIICDLLLAAIAIPMAFDFCDLLDFGAYRVIASRASVFFFDMSFCFSLCISLIAYYIVNMQGSMTQLNPYLLASLAFIPPTLHVLFDCAVELAEISHPVILKNLANATLQTIVFLVWFTSFYLTYRELRINRLIRISKCLEAGLKREEAKHKASSIMMNLIVALIAVNLLLWLPVVVMDWFTLQSDFTPDSKILLLISISFKGIFHSYAILFVLGKKHETKDKVFAMEMRRIDSDTIISHIKAPRKAYLKGFKIGKNPSGGLLYCPSPDSSTATQLDYFKA